MFSISQIRAVAYRARSKCDLPHELSDSRHSIASRQQSLRACCRDVALEIGWALVQGFVEKLKASPVSVCAGEHCSPRMEQTGSKPVPTVILDKRSIPFPPCKNYDTPSGFPHPL